MSYEDNDAKPTWTRLNELAHRIDEATEFSADPDELNSIMATLEELSSQLFEACKKRGIVL